MKKERENSQKLKEKALNVSIEEGTAANISTNVGDSYVIPFALALNASSTQVGILSSFSTFLYQLSQLFGPKMMERYSRKKIVLYFVFLQALTWLFVAGIAIAVWKNLFASVSIWLLIGFYSILMAFGGISQPAWFSWMGDLVQKEKRGAYFGKRNRIISSVGIIAALLAAFFLDYFKTKGYVLLAFSILFALAFLFKFVSYLLLHKQYSPQFKQKKRDYFSFFSFIKKFDNFGKFAVYQGFFNFAIMIASPFFTVYMLRELGFSYTIFITTLVSYTIFYLVALPLAGKFSDKYGNRMLTIVTNFFFVLTPLFYIVFKSPLWIIIVPQLTAGIANAASVISFSNFIYDSVSPKHRALCSAYANVLIGIGVLFGALVGGLIIDYFHPLTMNPYIFVFIVAIILRFLVAVIFLPEIKEVRRVSYLPSRYTFFMIPMNFLHTEGIKLIHLPEKILGKFKSLKFLAP
jgi:MFS family permease